LPELRIRMPLFRLVHQGARSIRQVNITRIKGVVDVSVRPTHQNRVSERAKMFSSSILGIRVS
jgi:hypothetical protein